MSDNRFQIDRNKHSKTRNIFLRGRNRNKGFENLTKGERLMNGVGDWTSFYRANPHRFVRDFFGINLKLFQQILLFMMMTSHNFMYIASRGQGKTFLTAIYIVTRAILYPGSKIIIAAGQKSQSREVIEKVNEILNEGNSPLIEREISNLKSGTNESRIDFHNGSWIRTVTASDGARGARANILIVDEFRMVDLNVVDTVLRKFLISPRQPAFLRKKEYAKDKEKYQERNQQIYLSSAWYKHHWSYERFRSYFNTMMSKNPQFKTGKGRTKYFAVSIPYHMPLKEGLLVEDEVVAEMSESDFDQTKWDMEMEALFFGESEKAFFKHEELEGRRVLSEPIYPKHFYENIKSLGVKKPRKEKDEIRILACDIAVMGGKENDSSIFSLTRMRKSGDTYKVDYPYMESLDGGHSETQALRIKQLYDDLECDYVALDTMGVGMGVYDKLVRSLVDKERSREYDAWTCINDEDMASRTDDPNADPVIYSIKATENINSDIALTFRDGLRRGNISLLVHENVAKYRYNTDRSYHDLSVETQVDVEMPFIQTTALINEMINLEREQRQHKIRLKEPRSGRKDRYSSVGYGYYVALILEREQREENYYLKDDEEIVILSSGF